MPYIEVLLPTVNVALNVITLAMVRWALIAARELLEELRQLRGRRTGNVNRR